MSSKTITAKNKHDPNSTHDHREITASDIPQVDGSQKRGLDVVWGNAPTDSFGRIRTSGTAQRLDVEFLYDKQPDYFDEITNNGTVTHNADSRDLTLSRSDGNAGSYAKMASYPVPYTPGNSQLVDITGVLDLADIGGGNAEVFLRSSVSGTTTEQVITQQDWLVDTSTIDWSKSHIFTMDFQSLKVGRIQYAMVQDGLIVPMAQITNDNKYNTGYWELANLPVYYEIYTDSGFTYMEMGYGNDQNAIGFRYKITQNVAATMKAICCTVKSEGGPELRNMPGLPRTVNRGITPYTVSTTLVPLISIRPKTTFQSLDNLMLSIPKTFGIQTDESILFVVLHNATLGSPVWTDVAVADSCIEYDISATGLTGGHELYSDYIYASTSGGGAGSASRGVVKASGLLGKTVLWNRLSSETGILTIAAIRTGASDASVLASINWDEIR